MSKLVSPEAVAIRLGFGELDSIGDEGVILLEASIEAATVHLQTILRVASFEYAEYTEKYWVDQDEFPYVGPFPKLYLSAAPVDMAPEDNAYASFEVRLAVSPQEFATATPIPAEDYMVDTRKGLVLATGAAHQLRRGYPSMLSHWSAYFVQCQYTAGYKKATTGLFQDVPAWLSEAATYLAVKLYKSGQDCDESKVAALACNQVMSLLEPYVRYYPSALKPLV